MYTVELPTYREVSRGFGFPVPHSYYKLLEVAFALNPNDPWNAYEALDFIYLDNTRANPAYVYPGHDYPSTPVELFVIGWTGTDGGHYGFLVDDLPTAAQELPIAEVYPPEGKCRLLGMNLAEFLSIRISECIRDYGEEWHRRNLETILALVKNSSVNAARNVDELLVNAVLRRTQEGGVFTVIDQCGARVPKHLVDWTFWERIDWEAVRRENSLSQHLLNDAEFRLTRGDHITAFLIAKNLWMLYWQNRSGGDGPGWIRRTGNIMEQTYRLLERPNLADKMRKVIAWILEEVVRA